MKWADKEITWLSDNYLFHTRNYLSEYLGKSKRAVSNKLGVLGLRPQSEQVAWTQDEVSLLYKMYPFKSRADLIEIFSPRHWPSIKDKAQRLGIKRDPKTTFQIVSAIRRKNTFDQNFFREINTENRAYLLGFILGDGCNYKNQSLRILLHKRDIELLDFTKNIMSFSGRIYCSRKNYVELVLHSELLMADLIKCGVVTNKTHNMTIPDTQYKRDLLRGLFDSDGCVYIHQNIGQSTVAIVGHQNTCEWVKKTLKESIDISGNIYKVRNHYRWELRGRNQLKDFARWLYSSSGFFLLRKYEKFYLAELI
jgi:hypothetical protein